MTRTPMDLESGPSPSLRGETSEYSNMTEVETTQFKFLTQEMYIFNLLGLIRFVSLLPGREILAE